jgi:hypothetical protein
MSRRGLVVVVIALGSSIVALSVAADAIGLGGGNYVFGWEQKLGVAVGTAMVWFTVLHALGWRARLQGDRPLGDSGHTVTPLSA